MSTDDTWARLGAEFEDSKKQTLSNTLHAVGGDVGKTNNPAGTPFGDTTPADFPNTVPSALLDQFDMGDLVAHIRTGGQYVVLDTPSNMLVLERTGERAYMYRRCDTGADPRKWVRCQSEMEDGRFVIHRKAPSRR